MGWRSLLAMAGLFGRVYLLLSAAGIAELCHTLTICALAPCMAVQIRAISGYQRAMHVPCNRHTQSAFH